MKIIENVDVNNASESSVGDNSIQSNSPSFSSNPNTSSGKSEECNKETIRAALSKQGTPAVFRLRLLVILVMTLTATAVSVIIYRTTSEDENHEYNNHYEKSAEKILESFEGIFDKILTVNSVGVAATAYGLDHNDTKWPFHTLSSFQQRAATARLVSGALFISIEPIVSDEDRYQWEEYVARTKGIWM
jgi:hypothetical protein